MSDAGIGSALLPKQPGLVRTFSVRLGLPMHTLHRTTLLLACLLGVIQYGLVSVFGVIVDDMAPYYHLSASAANRLYDAINFGACALSFLPGICYDRLGATAAMALGTAVGVLPVLVQLDWSRAFPALDTLTGLEISYVLFGTAEAFFSVIATFAPLEAFPPEHLGKVSAVVQLSTSLGVSVQSEAYALMQAGFSDFVRAYYTYMLVCTLGCGMLMTGVFWENNRALHRNKARATPAKAPGPDQEAPVAAAEAGAGSLASQLLSVDFAYMSLVFVAGIGFVFSYLDGSSLINSAVGLPATRATFDFGIYGALGRVAVNCALDRLRRTCPGAPFLCLAASLLVFAAGLLCVALPSAPGPAVVSAMNYLCSCGGGAMLGVAPPALRLLFGTGFLGFIYGVLYMWVALAIPTWGLLLPDAASGGAASCYRPYCGAGAAASVALAVLSLGLLVARRPRS